MFMDNKSAKASRTIFFSMVFPGHILASGFNRMAPYEYPFLGMKLGISKDLKEQMEKKNISMFTNSQIFENNSVPLYFQLIE